MKRQSGKCLIQTFALWATMLPAAVLLGQTYSDPCEPSQSCAAGADCNADCNGDTGCGDTGCHDTGCGGEQGGLFQFMLGMGPYSPNDYGYDNSYGFGLTERSRSSGAGLFGLFGNQMSGSGYGYGGGAGYGGAGFGGGAGYGGGTANQGLGGQQGFAGAAAHATPSAVPDMIGDSSFVGGGYALGFMDSSFSHLAIGEYYSQPVPLPAFHLTRLNMAEKFNAQVQNRVYVDWRYFSGAGSLSFNGDEKSLNASNATFEFERKVGQNSSLELRIPVLYNLDSGQQLTATSTGLTNATKLGNMSLVYKQVLRRTHRVTYTGGLGMNTPTAKSYDYSFNLGNETGRIQIGNDIWRLTPYIGFQWHPNRYAFGQFLTQIDVPLSQSNVTAEFDGDSEYGKFYDQTILRINGSIGRWFYRNERASYLTAVGGMLEFHYSQTLNNACDRAVWTTGSNGFTGVSAVSTLDRSDVLNMVAGLPLEFGKTTVMNALTIPLGDQRYFTTEYNLSVSRRF